jgi:hypothetical protein
MYQPNPVQNASPEIRQALLKEILGRSGMNAKIDGLREIEKRLGLRAVPQLTTWSGSAQALFRAKDYLGSYNMVEAGLEALLHLPPAR